jgi:hypothetical protein
MENCKHRYLQSHDRIKNSQEQVRETNRTTDSQPIISSQVDSNSGIKR